MGRVRFTPGDQLGMTGLGKGSSDGRDCVSLGLLGLSLPSPPQGQADIAFSNTGTPGGWLGGRHLLYHPDLVPRPLSLPPFSRHPSTRAAQAADGGRGSLGGGRPAAASPVCCYLAEFPWS